MTEKEKSTIFYGWWMVVLLCYTLIHTAGNGFYGFSVYVPRLISDLGCTTAGLMLGAAVWAVVFGFSNPIIGIFMHKYGVRKIFITGVILAGIPMFLLSFITQLWHLYALNMIAGFVGAATILVPSQTLITAWFSKRRGIAIALTLMGVGIGGFVIPLLAAWMIQEFGWRNSFRIGAVLNYIIVLPPLVIFLKDKPADVGQYVDGVEPVTEERKTSAKPKGVTSKRALNSPAFWLITGVYILQLFVMSGIQLNVQNFAEKQMGYSLFMATRFIAFALFVTLPARFIFGWLCDRVNPKYLMGSAGFFLMGGAWILWFCVIKLGWVNDYRAIGLFALFQGFGISGSAVVLPILVGRCFGEKEFPKIMGLVMAGFAIGVIFGPFTLGKIFDLTRSYADAFILTAWVGAAAGVMALFIPTETLKDEFRH
jgi:MFS family permease